MHLAYNTKVSDIIRVLIRRLKMLQMVDVCNASEMPLISREIKQCNIHFHVCLNYFPSKVSQGPCSTYLHMQSGATSGTP